MAEQVANGGLPLRVAQFLGKPAEPRTAADVPRPNGDTAPAALPPRAAIEPGGLLSGNAVDARTMIVGKETSFSGRIGSCSRLIVEGIVEATLEGCQHLIVTESGAFKGDSATENADIYGSLEGRLAVSKRLMVRASARLSGTISYGEIEIERGGRITGTIHPDGVPASQAGRAPLAQGLAMNRGRRKSARPRDYRQTDLTERDGGGPNGSATPDL